MSPGFSTRTVHDLSPWAALSIKFAGLLTALGGAVTGLILLDNSWLQLLIADALGVIFAQFDFLGHEASHRQVPASRPPTTYRPPEGFVALPCAQWFGILPRRTRRDADCVRPEPGAHPLLGHDRAVACAGRSFPGMEPDGGPRR